MRNPVWDDNFPDPQVIPDGDGWVAIATNGGGSNVQTLTSTDLTTWQRGPDALPTLPDWTSPGKVWAPEAARIGDQWVMYYTTRGPDPSLQCVGRAVAEAPGGPYTDDSDGPLVFEDDAGGSIDASPYTDPDGRHWLLWKNDGNAVGQDTWISMQRLSDDGLTLTGDPTRLIRQDLDWEGDLVEAPFVWFHDDTFHLFYSANAFASADYAVGHAVAHQVTGPYAKDPEPILTSNDVAAGPGHCALFTDHDGQVWMVYHAWDPESIGSVSPGRTMWLSRVGFGPDGTVTVEPPAV